MKCTLQCLYCTYVHNDQSSPAYLQTSFVWLAHLNIHSHNSHTVRFFQIDILSPISEYSTQPLTMGMSNLRYLATTTILGLALSYALHQYHGEENIRHADCSGYQKGNGLDVNGNPFQVIFTAAWSCDLNWIPQDMDSFYPYYLCEHVQPATKLFHFIATFNGLSLLGRSLVGEWQWAGIGLAFLQVGYIWIWFATRDKKQIWC